MMRVQRGSVWPGRDEELRELWGRVPKISTKDIGLEMKLSKNSIVSRAHRLKLPARESPIQNRRPDGAAPKRASPVVAGASTIPPLNSLAPAAQEAPRPAQSVAPFSLLAGALSPPAASVAPARAIPAPKPIALAPASKPPGRVRECAYMEGDVQPYPMCGAPTRPGSSWCDHHHRICFTTIHRLRHSAEDHANVGD